MWNNLYLREEGSYAVEYYSEYVTGVKVAYVKAGEGVTAEKVASATKAGNIFKGWNTKKNGKGDFYEWDQQLVSAVFREALRGTAQLYGRALWH